MGCLKSLVFLLVSLACLPTSFGAPPPIKMCRVVSTCGTYNFNTLDGFAVMGVDPRRHTRWLCYKARSLCFLAFSPVAVIEQFSLIWEAVVLAGALDPVEFGFRGVAFTSQNRRCKTMQRAQALGKESLHAMVRTSEGLYNIVNNFAPWVVDSGLFEGERQAALVGMLLGSLAMMVLWSGRQGGFRGAALEVFKLMAHWYVHVAGLAQIKSPSLTCHAFKRIRQVHVAILRND